MRVISKADALLDILQKYSVACVRPGKKDIIVRSKQDFGFKARDYVSVGMGKTKIMLLKINEIRCIVFQITADNYTFGISNEFLSFRWLTNFFGHTLL